MVEIDDVSVDDPQVGDAQVDYDQEDFYMFRLFDWNVHSFYFESTFFSYKLPVIS